ncbi:MAG: DUF2977 domain-containing protein [Lachnospiraceae bacterium]|nr:DUF2977 domain-containing protein [Lachnospiraceae bacterium]
MKASFDKNGYFTGNYALTGDLRNSVNVNSIPDESDRIKITSYQYIDGEWVFDQDYYRHRLEEGHSEELARIKAEMTGKSKQNLKRYLEIYKLSSSCHGGIEKQYSITSEKQQHLANMILTATMAAQAGIPYQPSWNAAGEECTYDWTIGELQQLAMEMEGVVRPLVSKQQRMEVAIQEAHSLEDLESIDISF